MSLAGTERKRGVWYRREGENGADRNFRGNYYRQQRRRLVPRKLPSGHLIFISSNYYLAIKFYSSLCMHAPGTPSVLGAPGVVKGRRRMSLSTEVMDAASFLGVISVFAYLGVLMPT